MLRINIENKIYPNGYRALGKIQLDFPDRGLYIIYGESGCGKSTLINCIGGNDDFDGELIFNGSIIKGRKNIDKFRKYSVSTVFQDFRLLDGLAVADNISLAKDVIGAECTSEDVNSLLDEVGLPAEYADRQVSELSYGEMQRVAIARAVAKNSAIIIADEPTANLDSENAENIAEILKRLSEKSLVLVVSHNIELFDKFCDGKLKLVDGEIEQIVMPESFSCSANSCKDAVIVSKTSNIKLLKKLVANQRKIFIKSIALSVLAVFFMFILSISLLFAQVNYESAVVNTLNANEEYERTVYLTFMAGEEVSDDLYSEFTGFKYVSVDGLDIEEYQEYMDNIKQNDLYYGNGLPIFNRIVYSDSLEETGYKLIIGSDTLSGAQIYIPSRYADAVIAIGHTTKIFDSQKSVNDYSDLIGCNLSLKDGEISYDLEIAGIYRSSAKGIITFGDYEKLSDRKKSDYLQKTVYLAQDISLICSKELSVSDYDGIVLDYNKYKSDVFDLEDLSAYGISVSGENYYFVGSAGIREATNSIVSVRNYLLIPIAVLFAAIVMLVTYISMSTAIIKSRKQIVLLRALGMPLRELFAVFVVSALIVSLIQIAITCILNIIVVPILNLIVNSIATEYSFVLFGISFSAMAIPALLLIIGNIGTAFVSLSRLFAKSVERTYKEV